MRYLMPLPVPQRWRRRMIALGSGDPTRIICSALIAQAFESVRYPILPKVTRMESRVARREILEIRHHSLYAPRDFDISPYFAVVKPTIEHGFDYKKLHWADLPLPPPSTRRCAVVDAGEATLVPQARKRRRRARVARRERPGRLRARQSERVALDSRFRGMSGRSGCLCRLSRRLLLASCSTPPSKP